MTTSLTRNLKLKVNSNLTAEAKYNIQRLDLLGGTFLTDSTDTLKVRSQTDILIEPESADIGGSGVGGAVSFGSASHSLSTISFFADAVTFSGALGFDDQATGGTKQLFLKYKSDLSGSVDTAADRTLFFDLDGANRNFILGGSFSLTGGDVTLTSPGGSILSLPGSGTLSTLAGSETFTNKSIDATSNTLTNIGNASISTSAGIAYSKLALAGSIQNSDLVGPVSIAKGGTGAITATAALTALLPSQTGNAGKVLQTNGTTASWQTGGGGGGGDVSVETVLWSSSDGASKTAIHSLGTTAVVLSIIDLADNSLIGIDSIVVQDSSTLLLTASEAPSVSGWSIIIEG